MSTQRKGFNWIAAAPWLYTAALFIVWELVARGFNLPQYILPAPSRVAQAIWQYWPAIWKNSLQTLYTTSVGFALAVVGGLALGILVGWSRFIYAGLYPLMVGFNAIPKVAVVPILVIWFGIGTVPAILTAFLIAFFPIVINTMAGFKEVDRGLTDVFRSVDATERQMFFRLRLPYAMPYIFGSLKIAITLAFVGSVIAETVAANSGLGHMMLAAQSQFNVPLVWAGLIMLAIEGIIMYALMAWIEMRMTGWAHRSQMANA